MKKLLIHCKRCAVLLLALTAAFAVSCTGDLEDDIADLNDQLTDQSDKLDDLQSQIDTLEDKLDDNVTIDKIDGNIIYFSDGTELDLSTEGLEIVDECDEFYVISVADETYVAYKDNVIFPSDISLAGFDTLTTKLVEGEEYNFRVQINPANHTISPSNFYLVGYEANASVTKGLIEDVESSESTPHGNVNEQLRVVATDVVDEGNGSYIISCVWTAAEVEVSDIFIYVSVEYPKYYYDADTNEAVRGYEWILSDTYLGQDLGYVLITEADVTASAFVSGSTTVISPEVLHMAEGTEYVYVLQDQIATSFITENLKGAAFVALDDATDPKNTPKVTDYDDLDSAFSDAVEYNTTIADETSFTKATAAVDTSVKSWGSYGVYKNTTGANATLTLTAPIIDNTSTYAITAGQAVEFAGTILYDDRFDNTDADGKILTGSNINKYYSSVSGGVTATAPTTVLSKGYVSRPLTIYVHSVDTLLMKAAVRTNIPSTVDGTIDTSFDSADDTKSVTASYVAGGFATSWGTVTTNKPELSGSITYAPVGSEIDYSDNESAYGYVLDVDYDAYAKYVETKGDDFVTLSIAQNTTDHHAGTTTYDFVADISLASTADQPLLPGKYVITSTYKMTYADEDGNVVYEGYKVYTQTIILYAPQFVVEMIDIAAINGRGVEYQTMETFPTDTNDDVYKAYPAGKGLQMFTTYEWYDFDLARLVDVDTVDSWINTTEVTSYEYPMTEVNLSSTTYSDVALALYDYKNGEYTQSRFFAEDASSTLESVSVLWDDCLSVEIDGQEGISTLVTVEPLATGSADVYKKVTFYQTLSTGLKIPVQLVKSGTSGSVTTTQTANSNAVVLPEDKGSLVIAVKINGINTNSIKSDGSIDGTYNYSSIYQDSNQTTFSGTLDYTDNLSRTTSDYKVAVNGTVATRRVKSFNYGFTATTVLADFGVGNVPSVIADVVKTAWNNNIIFDSVAFKAATETVTSYTASFVAYIVTQESGIANADEFYALDAAAQKTIADAHESAFTTANSGVATEVTTGSVTSATPYLPVSQIGDGSADRSTTVDLLPEGAITYSVIKANSTDPDLITVDTDGYIYQATTDAMDSTDVYTVTIRTCITDIVGGTCYSDTSVKVKY